MYIQKLSDILCREKVNFKAWKFVSIMLQLEEMLTKI